MTFSDDDVDLRGIAEDAYRLAESCGHTHVECIEAAVNHVLGALRDADRLLPEGAETRTEWGVRVDRPHPKRRETTGTIMTHFPPENARRAPEVWDGWTALRREHRGWPDGSAYVGPWVPVPPLFLDIREAKDGEQPCRFETAHNDHDEPLARCGTHAGPFMLLRGSGTPYRCPATGVEGPSAAPRSSLQKEINDG